MKLRPGMGLFGLGKKRVKHVDPVCGMTVEEGTQAGTLEHQGVRYYFCSVNCMSSFQRDPTPYVR
jgi:YHS domain-containing protein